jgi:hypothetical protein
MRSDVESFLSISDQSSDESRTKESNRHERFPVFLNLNRGNVEKPIVSVIDGEVGPFQILVVVERVRTSYLDQNLLASESHQGNTSVSVPSNLKLNPLCFLLLFILPVL